MRILNPHNLSSHGNARGRKDMLAILEAGLQAADPYNNTLKLLRIQNGTLIVGCPDFDPAGSPKSGNESFALSKVGSIFVFGAGKGVHRVAKAIEEVLGDRLTGGHIIVKHGDDCGDLERIEVTHGAHPVPDENCVRGCERIMELSRGLREEDLVFTIAANGISALLTMPAPGVSLDDVRQTTYLMQIVRGAPTRDLNPVRNHLDMMKGGRISSLLQPAKAIHIVVDDADDSKGVPTCCPNSYDRLMRENLWLHTLPDCTTFEDAVTMLKKWDAWDEVPASVRQHLTQADTRDETVKASEFEKMAFRIFGIMPAHWSMLHAARSKAEQLGYTPVTLCSWLEGEAKEAGTVVASIAKSVARDGLPFNSPCALFTTGELLVTVGDERGWGGRNQEYALSAAITIAGSRSIVMGAVDSDGTDGPGRQFADNGDDIPALAGGIVDGETQKEARIAGVDIHAELRKHNSTPALWKLNSGIVATHNISVTDLGVTLVLDQDPH